MEWKWLLYATLLLISKAKSLREAEQVIVEFGRKKGYRIVEA